MNLHGKFRIAMGLLFFLLTFFILYTGNTVAKNTKSITLGVNGPVNSRGIPSPWTLMEKEGKAFAKIISESGEPVLNMYSEKSSFCLQRKFHADIKDYPYIKWVWKALTLPLSGDVRNRKKNDQALQVLIAFDNKRILSYIWDANAPVGTITDESVPWPVSLRVKVFVVNSGISDVGKWIAVSRNIYKDYKKAFGEEPSDIKGVRVQINTQYTGETAESFFKKIIFSQFPKTG